MKAIKKDLQVAEWFKRAKDDELNVRSLLKHGEGTASGVCFFSQQMAEKYCKAFLVFHKNWYPKTPVLDVLWKFCREVDEGFEEIKKKAIFLTDFYAETRYPGDYPEFSWKEAKKAFAAAESIRDFILARIKHKS